MSKAHYEIEDDGTYYGEIAECPGVFSTAKTLEECRATLQEVLEGWIILGLRLGHQLPIINGVDLQQRLAA